MPEPITPEGATPDEIPTDETPEEVEHEEAPTELGDAGKKALDAMKAARNAAKASEKAAIARAVAAEAALANRDKPAEELAIAERIREATAAVTSKANERIVRSEVKLAAAGRVKNPALALKLIDTSEIDVNDDGEVDADALAAAIDTLLTDYPELAAKAPGFGSADQGAKSRTAAPSQLTRSDLDSMSPEQINAARRSGRLDKVLGIKS